MTTEGKMTKVASRLASIIAMATILLVWCSSRVLAQSAGINPPMNNRAAESQPDETKSLTEVNKELSNPISTIWSLTFQENTYWLTAPAGHAERNNINL